MGRICATNTFKDLQRHNHWQSEGLAGGGEARGGGRPRGRPEDALGTQTSLRPCSKPSAVDRVSGEWYRDLFEKLIEKTVLGYRNSNQIRAPCSRAVGRRLGPITPVPTGHAVLCSWFTHQAPSEDLEMLGGRPCPAVAPGGTHTGSSACSQAWPLERSHLLSGLRDTLSTQKPWALQGANTCLSPLPLWGRLPVWALGFGAVT